MCISVWWARRRIRVNLRTPLLFKTNVDNLNDKRHDNINYNIPK